ncbi:hypothetical protein PIB30_095732 [Stylosanthes scabra]|uniref:Uncharacterized protein n=1 Tax=Stylosanthes scabra TaxID=79078 RepID=A0ABU6ZUJ9_9FABA|nr:hypothetical protein [Stylosanthes scabra]
MTLSEWIGAWGRNKQPLQVVKHSDPIPSFVCGLYGNAAHQTKSVEFSSVWDKCLVPSSFMILDGDMDEIDRWADINQDLLQEISKRFFSYDDDCMKLRLVYKKWRLKLPKIPSGNKIPWLLLPEETYKNHCYEDEEIYHLMQ